MMKKIDEREMQKTAKEKQRQKGARGTETIVYITTVYITI